MVRNVAWLIYQRAKNKQQELNNEYTTNNENKQDKDLK
jgi:hypothetical protein